MGDIVGDEKRAHDMVLLLNIGGTENVTVAKNTLCSIKGSKIEKYFNEPSNFI